MTAKDDIKTDLERLFPYFEESSTVIVSCSKPDYCASRLCHAIEDCNAHVLNLNIIDTSIRYDESMLFAHPYDTDFEADTRVYIEVRISHRDARAVTRSLERYGFTVEFVRSDAADSDDFAADRINNFFRMLNV